MQLTDIEINQIRLIIDNYRSIHSDLDFYEKSLNAMEKKLTEKDPDAVYSLGTKIRESVSKLNQEREKEKDFFDFLNLKYGPGELDMDTLEYKRKESIKN